MKKILALILVACMAFSLCACDFAKDLADSTLNIKAQAKTFDFDGISIELTTDFVRMDFISDEYDFIVGTETLTLMGIKVENEGSALDEIPVKDFAENFRSLILIIAAISIGIGALAQVESGSGVVRKRNPDNKEKNDKINTSEVM